MQTLGALFVVTALGCGGGGDTPDASVSVEPGDRDAGADAAQSDGGELRDAAMDPADAEPQTDSGTPLDKPEGLTGNCVSADERVFTVAESAQPFPGAPLAVDPVRATYAMPYVKAGSCLDGIYWSSLAGDGSADNLAFDGCSLVRDSATTAVGDGQWLLAAVDNREPPYDVWIAPYASADGTMADATRLTQNSHVETGLTMTTLQSGDKVVIAYADADDTDGQAVYVRLLDTAGQPLGDAVTLESSKDLYYHGLSVRPLGTQGAALVYVRYSLDYTTSDIVLVALDADGQPVREPWVLASNAGPSPSVDVTWSAAGGGVVYARSEASTGRQIWFQQLDDTGSAALLRDGKTPASALRVVFAPHRGVDVSVTKLSSSFVMAYRELPDPAGTETRAKIRVYFLDRYGAVIGSSDVAYTSSGSGRTSIRSANDGSVVLSWDQVNDEGGSTLKALHLPCVGG